MLVDSVTKLEKLNISLMKNNCKANNQNVGSNGARFWVIMVKLADRLHNMLTLKHFVKIDLTTDCARSFRNLCTFNTSTGLVELMVN